MSSSSGLPAFFQSNTKTVLDELADFELGGGLEDDYSNLGGETLLDDSELETFGGSVGGFGDLNAENLPDFFKNPTQLEQENYDIFDSMANQTLDDDLDLAALHLPAGARVSSAFPQTNQPPAQPAMPPGLATSNSVCGPPATAVNYKDLLAAMGTPTAQLSAPLTVPEQASAPQPAASTPAAPFSYARAVAPASQSQLPPQPPAQQQQLPHAGGPPGMMPPGPASAFLSSQPAYVLNPHLAPAPTAGILRGTSASTVATVATGATGATGTSHNTGFSAQKPLLYNSATGFSTPSAVPTGKFHGTAPQFRKELPKGKFMTPSDVRYVVNKVLQPMESTDPFADDFYFLQLSIKKNAAAREAALRQQQELPSPIYVPLPVWKETKDRIRLQMDATRKTFHQRSREWEQKEKVLGHQVRSDIHRPREQLSMPSMADIELDMDGDDDEAELKNPFSSRLWTMRRAVQRGYEALYTVQELQHLLSSPLIASNPAAHSEICREIDSAVQLLSQSLGIRSPPCVPGMPMPTEAEIALDGGHVGAILQTAIGRKLMTRSLKLLSPPHRWALLPVILAKILLSPPAQDSPSSNNSSVSGTVNEALAVEQRLLKTIIEFLQYSFQFQIEQQSQVPPGSVAIFTDVLLSNLRQCIKSVMVTQMEKSKLRQALISERTRAEVMHMVVQIGDKVMMSAERRLAEEWVQTREAFMSMLDN